MRRQTSASERRAAARRFLQIGCVVVLATLGYLVGSSLRAEWTQGVHLHSRLTLNQGTATVELTIEGVDESVPLQFLGQPSRLGIERLRVTDASGRPIDHEFDWQRPNPIVPGAPSLILERGSEIIRLRYSLNPGRQFDETGDAHRRMSVGDAAAVLGRALFLVPRVKSPLSGTLVLEDELETRDLVFDSESARDVLFNKYVLGTRIHQVASGWRLYLDPAFEQGSTQIQEEFATLDETLANTLPSWREAPFEIHLFKRASDTVPLVRFSDGPRVVLDMERPHPMIWVEVLRHFARDAIGGDWVSLGLAELVGDEFLTRSTSGRLSLLQENRRLYDEAYPTWDLSLSDPGFVDDARTSILKLVAVKGSLVLDLVHRALKQSGHPEGAWSLDRWIRDGLDPADALRREGGSELAEQVMRWCGNRRFGVHRSKALTFTREKATVSEGDGRRELSFVFFGDGDGLLETCSCDPSNAGGLARKGQFVESLRRTGLDPILIDLGQSVTSRGPRLPSAMDDTEQGLYLDLLDLAKLDVLITGTAEIQRGEDVFRTWFSRRRFARVGANVQRASRSVVDDPAGSLVAPFALFERNGARIAIIGYSDRASSLGDEYIFGGAGSPLELDANPRRMSDALDLVPDADCVIVAGHIGSTTLDYILEHESTRVDVVLTGDANVRRACGLDQRSWMGGFVDDGVLVLVDALGSQGASYAKVTFTESGEIVSFTSDVTKLDSSVEKDPQIQARLDSFYEDSVERELQGGGAIIPFNQSDPVFSGAYVGSKACHACHEAQTSHYLTTPHATAFQTLIRAGRQSTIQCTPCHVVGYGHETGWDPRRPDPELRDVGCESCHGPGGAHVQNPIAGSIRKTPTEETCTSCHDPKHSPRFWSEFKSRWAKTRH